MLNAKKRFIDQMKDETEAYMYNLSSMIPGFSGKHSDALMALYPTMAEKAITQMTLIACEKHPEAFCQFIICNACSTYLLDKKNDAVIIQGSSLTPAGKAIMDLFKLVLNSIASDPATPSGKHNAMQLEFVQKQLAARMK